MHAKKSIAALLALAAMSAAYAEEFNKPDTGFVSVKTRAEVIAEVKRGKRAIIGIEPFVFQLRAIVVVPVCFR